MKNPARIALVAMLAGPAAAADTGRAAKAAKLDFTALCLELGRTLRSPARTPEATAWRIAVAREATSTTRFSERDVANIQARRPVIGMADCSVMAAIGRPDKINRTTTAAGQHDQWIYRKTGVYVYISNGLVTSWQE